MRLPQSTPWSAVRAMPAAWGLGRVADPSRLALIRFLIFPVRLVEPK